jgi:hypothetical protein
VLPVLLDAPKQRLEHRHFQCRSTQTMNLRT